ncbi:MAG: hydroxymethylglutaryl-CoA lyase [Gammaproteobacteria bacterium PRO9]|nr:hydroxymethylglutaryl-CoA lyase [Gammaproteobacteria bacterium PRO9]
MSQPARHVSIIEVGPRDGLQSEPEILPTATKIEFIKRAIDAGIRRMEVTSFVHPKRVPQMADAEEVIRGLPRDQGITYIGLVLNRKGFERAQATGIPEIGMAVVASDTYNQRNQGVPTSESVKAWVDIARAAKAAGIRANVMISSAFGCPFEGEVPLKRVLELVDQVMEGDPVELGIADSIGVGVPSQVRDMLGAIRERVRGVPIRCHFHNTRNTGIANAQAAVDMGVDSLDASIGGIGGCPFAPAATGNIPTDDLLYMLDRSGVQTGVSLQKIISTSQWLAEQLGRGTPAMLPKAGIFPQIAEVNRARLAS